MYIDKVYKLSPLIVLLGLPLAPAPSTGSAALQRPILLVNRERAHRVDSRPCPIREHFSGGLSIGVPSGRFPVDVSTVQISAFFCTQTVRAPESARFPQSDTKFPRLSPRNNRMGSSPDITGDNPPVRRKAAGNHRVIASTGSVRSVSGRRRMRHPVDLRRSRHVELSRRLRSPNAGFNRSGISRNRRGNSA